MGQPGREWDRDCFTASRRCLARSSHQSSAAGRDLPQPAALACTRSLDVLPSTPPSLALRKRHILRHLATLATNTGEKIGLAAALVAVLVGPGCMPLHEGPQLKDPPPGMGYISSILSARKPLPDRATTRQLGYVGAGDSGDMVVITEYPGPTFEEEAEQARASYEARYTSTEYGPFHSLDIDGQPAWGWLETQEVRGEVASVQLTAIVSYDDVSYSIELTLHPPRLLGAERMREIVESFYVP